MITHRNLKYALKLAETGNYRRAADALHITHSALVRGIKALENYLEIRMFERGGGVKVTPTDIGRTFLEHARRITIAEGDLIQELQAQVGLEKGILRVAMGSFPSKMCGHAAIGRLLQRHHTLKFKVGILQYSKIMGVILGREFDIGISELGEAVKNEELRTEPSGEHIGAFFCRPGHPLLDRRSLIIPDLLEFPWCCTRMPSRITDHLPGDLGLAAEADPLTVISRTPRTT